MITWTPELIAELTRLWNEDVPAPEIARRLGITKNAVVGKAHRLKLPGRPSPIIRDPSRPKIAMLPRRPKTEAPPVEPPRLSRDQCRWPIGHPGEPDFRFCSERAIEGKPYCPEHMRRAYVGKAFKGEPNRQGHVDWSLPGSKVA